MIVIDRSRLVSYQECPRKRFLAYEWQGRGLQPVRQAVPLLTGSLIHEALAAVIGGEPTSSAIGGAQRKYREIVEQSMVNQPSSPQSSDTEGDTTLNEQVAMLEAIVLAYSMVKLPALLREYEVLDVEREFELVLDDYVAEQAILLVRPDLVLRRRSDRLLFLLDFKTTAAPDKWWADSLRYDPVTLAQVLPVEAHYKEKAGGVLIEGLCKGRRLEYKGVYQHNSPLLYAWRSAKSPEKWAARYEWSCASEHFLDNGKVCGGGVTHKLSGYYKARVWEEYQGGIPAWLEYLKENDPSLMEEQFVSLPPILRSEYEIEEWRRSTLAQEIYLAVAAEHVKADADTLPEWFPKHAGAACVRPSRCSFFDMCHGVAGSDPLGSGLYQVREVNHPREVELRAGSEAKVILS